MILVIIFIVSHICVLNLVYCFEQSNIFDHFGTKTAYRLIENTDTYPLHYEGCKPEKIYMVIRHGTRLPGKRFILSMNSRLIELQNEIIKNAANLKKVDIENIRKWKISINENDEKFLTHEGEDEMTNLAERMQLRYPNILSEKYSNTSYKFKYTATQRTEKSAHYFAVGLFGRATAGEVWYPEPLHKDPILRFYKLCKKWRKEIKKNPAAIKERYSFLNSSYGIDVTKSVSTKLGFNKTLKFGDVYLMYLTCAFDTSWNKKLSPWCNVFSKENLQILEYSEDLEYYWVDGYGYDLTTKLACPLIKDLVIHFTRIDKYPKAVLYFTHSGTILKVLAHLGLFKDKEHLKHNNFESKFERLWRVSKIDTFGSNIAAVLYRCDCTDKILFLHQERVVRIPGCPEDLCDFKTFLDIFNESIYKCDFEKMCQL